MIEGTGDTPESEQNQPADLSMGWKVFDSTRMRFWTGKQWTETYRPIENTEMRLRKPPIGEIYESLPKQVSAVRYGKDEDGLFYDGAVDRVAKFMLGMSIDATLTQSTLMTVVQPGTLWEPDLQIEIRDDTIHHAWLPLALGDYVIRGIKGEYYPIGAEVLRDSYRQLS